MMTIQTVPLANGREVLARTWEGQVQPVTYANRTHAYKKQAALGDGWAVCQFHGRFSPFYVVRLEEEEE